MNRYKIPRLIFINKLDRAGANDKLVVEAIKKRLPTPSAPVQIPIGLESQHTGIVDLIEMKAYDFGGRWGLEVIEI